MNLALASIADYISSTQGLIDLIIAAVLGVLLIVFVWLIIKRSIPRVLFTLGILGLLAASLFEMRATTAMILVLLIILIVASIFNNAGEFRKIFANQFKGRTISPHGILPRKERIRKIYDRDEIYHQVGVAVEYLSRTKTGALMTFERKTPLNEVIKNGTLINSMVTAELIETIFYPGTRLHDGAVVIRDDMILAASVYYTATTKPLNGKYGSRHRAAIGISEISDSITVVVSEETGRISIAAAGELETVGLDNFNRVFREYMEE